MGYIRQNLYNWGTLCDYFPLAQKSIFCGGALKPIINSWWKNAR